MMNAKELRAAAERYRDLSGDIADALEGGSPHHTATYLGSLLHDLAEITTPMQSHILATVRDDDDEPVTKEWLFSIGLTRDNHRFAKFTARREQALSVGLWLVSDGWKAVLIFAEHSSANITRGLKTRGDVRRLCAVLGVEVNHAD